MSCTDTDAGCGREWLVPLGALLFIANENISSKMFIGIDKFGDRFRPLWTWLLEIA